MLPHAGRPPLHHGKVQQEHEGGGAVQQDRGERGTHPDHAAPVL